MIMTHKNMTGYYRNIESEDFGASYKLKGILRCLDENDARKFIDVEKTWYPDIFCKMFYDETEEYPWAVYVWERTGS